MDTLTACGAGYRTKCLERASAESFARCLEANGQFTEVAIHEEPRAKSERRFYVTYSPSDPQQREALLQRHQDQRRAKAETEGEQYLFVQDSENGRFYWCQSLSGQVYEVTLHGCSCPDATLRLAHLRHDEDGSPKVRCKHSLALEKAQERGGASPSDPPKGPGVRFRPEESA